MTTENIDFEIEFTKNALFCLDARRIDAELEVNRLKNKLLIDALVKVILEQELENLKIVKLCLTGG